MLISFGHKVGSLCFKKGNILLVVLLERRVSDGDVVVAVPVGPDPVERRPLLRQSRREPELFEEEGVQIRSNQSGVYKLERE